MKDHPHISLFTELQKALSDLERTSEDLGRENDSRYWNEACGKQDSARAKYNAVLLKLMKATK